MNTIKVIVKEPNKLPVVKEIEASLKSYQNVVGGYIETLTFPEEGVVLVFDEEGKFKDYETNIGLADSNGVVKDYIVGTLFVCAVDDEDFSSLSDEQIAKYITILSNCN